jgi:hypothetical protein
VKVDAHSAENFRVAVDTILTDAGAESEATEEKCEAIRRAGQAESAKTATRRLREVLNQVEVEETSLMAGSKPYPDRVARVHRGATAETDEAETEGVEPPVGQETEVPVSTEAEVTASTEAEQIAAGMRGPAGRVAAGVRGMQAASDMQGRTGGLRTQRTARHVEVSHLLRDRTTCLLDAYGPRRISL